VPLETGTYISDLVVTNPAHTDGLNQADAHARLIKSTLKATFPNINGAISSTDEQIDGAVSATANGSGVLKDTGEFFKTNTFDGITNPAAGQVAIVAKNSGGTASVQVVKVHGDTLATDLAGDANIAGKATVTGALAVTGKITGPGSVPVGGMLIWLTDTLPSDGNWCWANGGTLSRTTVGGGKELWDLWGSTYGLGDGVTTFNVINMQEVVPVGKSGMGGATPPGLLASIVSGLKGVLNGLFGSDTVSLSAGQIPTITSTGPLPDHTHPYTSPGGTNSMQGPGGFNAYTSTISASTGNPSTHPDVAVTSNNTGGATPAGHANVQPSRAVNFIIRIA
jgi:microcystin-dependent protein